MAPTAGMLMFCLVLSLNLSALTANPVHLSCKLKEMLHLLQYNLKSLNSTLNVTHVQPKGEVIEYLMKDKSPTCGLVYMERAFIKLRDHWKTIITVEEEFKSIIPKLKQNIIPCAQHTFGKCDQHPPKEIHLPPSDFKVKQWTRNFLDLSDQFIHRLLKRLKQ